MEADSASGFDTDGEIPERHVVLVAPEIHWNTGNVGRTCLGVGAHLHLIEPLGFSLDDRYLKRAGLDYWKQVSFQVWKSFQECVESLGPAEDELALFSKNGRTPFTRLPESKRMVLVFGSETNGLPANIFEAYRGCSYFIPTLNRIRCLNLSTAVGIGLYESIRKFPIPHQHPPA